MRLSLVGINHQTAPVAIREKVAISAEQLGDSLESLRAYIPQAIVLSTCNRTEIYTVDNGGNEGVKASLDFIRARFNPSSEDWFQHIYVSRDKAAAEHLFRVASGLDSMIVGEFEVLGQLRQTLAAAEKAGMVNLALRQAIHSAIRTGRRVRDETGISKNALSVSSVAVDLAAGKVGDLTRCKILVVGAGEAGTLVAKVAKSRGTPDIVIASRTKERAAALAETVHGRAIDLSELPAEMESANIIVACAGAPHRLLDIREVATAMQERPTLPLVIIDIALPRNVEPEVGHLKNVSLFNIDDLTEVSDRNRKHRESDIRSAEDIVAVELERFLDWWHLLEVRPLIKDLMSRAEAVRTAQLEKTLKKLPPLSAEQREGLEAMTKSIVTKVLIDPVKYLKSNGNSRDSDLLRELFGLNVEGQG